MSSIFDGIGRFVWHLKICYFDACCTILVLISYSFDTQATLILILIDIQYTQNAVFSFEKSSNYQNDSCLGSHHAVEKSPPPSKMSDSNPTPHPHPHPLLLFEKPWNMYYSFTYIQLHFMVFICFQSLFKVSVWDWIHLLSDCCWICDNA